VNDVDLLMEIYRAYIDNKDEMKREKAILLFRIGPIIIPA
jgi:hypothetical protein